MSRRTTRPGEAARAPLDRPVGLRFKHAGEFVDQPAANLSIGGMFIRTRRPHPVGSVFEFELRLESDRKLIAGKAQVAWVRRRGDSVDRPAGMGVRFVELDDDSRRQVGQRVAAIREADGQPIEIEPPPATASGEATPPTAQAAATAGATPGAPRSSTSVAPAGPALAPAVVRAQSQPRRANAKLPWLLLTLVVAAALAAMLWRRPAGEAPPPAGPDEPAPVAAERAAPAPAAAEPAPRPAQLRLVDRWARAWSQQRVDDYLAAYSPRFVPNGGLDRAAWERQRRGRILAPQRIEVALALVELEETGAGSSRVRFVQAYESNSYRDVVRKVLELELEEDGWRIVRELVEN